MAASLAAPLVFGSCAALAISGTSQGVAYTFNNIAYRTFTYTKPEVISAARQALKRMQIKYDGKETDSSSYKIFAEAQNLKIRITISSLTPRATKFAVNAKRNFLLKDRAVAAEIINQVDLALSGK